MQQATKATSVLRGIREDELWHCLSVGIQRNQISILQPGIGLCLKVAIPEHDCGGGWRVASTPFQLESGCLECHPAWRIRHD